MISAAILLILFWSMGCGTSAEDTIRDDAGQYASILSRLAALEVEAGEAFQSVVGDNFIDEDTTRLVLLDQVIPTYQKFLDGLEDIKPATEEVSEIHARFTDGAIEQMDGFARVLSSIDEGNTELISGANSRLARARVAMQEALQEVAQLAELGDG